MQQQPGTSGHGSTVATGALGASPPRGDSGHATGPSGHSGHGGVSIGAPTGGEDKGLLSSLKSKLSNRIGGRRRDNSTDQSQELAPLEDTYRDGSGHHDAAAAAAAAPDGAAGSGSPASGRGAAAAAAAGGDATDAVLADLNELHGVLVEGGLSGEMRARGAGAVARAAAMLAELRANAEAAARRAEAAEARIAAVTSALQVPMLSTPDGGSGSSRS